MRHSFLFMLRQAVISRQPEHASIVHNWNWNRIHGQTHNCQYHAHMVKCYVENNSSPLSAAYMSLIWISFGSGNGLLPVRHQAITWTNVDLLSIRPLGINFSEIRIKIYNFSFTKMHLEMSSVKWGPFCSGENELTPENRRPVKYFELTATPLLF